MAKNKENKKSLQAYIVGAIFLAASSFLVFMAINVVRTLLG